MASTRIVPLSRTSSKHAAQSRGLDSASTNRLAWSIGGVAVFALLTAAAAYIRIPLPGTPVPMTLQPLVVILAGMTLGPRLGLASMAIYLSLGAVGYQVFSFQNLGIQSIFGATGGYLIGFLLAQPLIGVLAERGRHAFWRFLAAALAGYAVIYAAGVMGLRLTIAPNFAAALTMGVLPFAVASVITTLASAALGVPMQRLFDRNVRTPLS